MNVYEEATRIADKYLDEVMRYHPDRGFIRNLLIKVAADGMDVGVTAVTQINDAVDNRPNAVVQADIANGRGKGE